MLSVLGSHLFASHAMLENVHVDSAGSESGGGGGGDQGGDDVVEAVQRISADPLPLAADEWQADEKYRRSTGGSAGAGSSSGASIGARMRKWRATADVCGRLRRGGQQQQRRQAQGTIDAGGPVQKQAPLGLIPARHRSAPAVIM
jgi:hypothetical protein